MSERSLGGIIRACSDTVEVVLYPFGGGGTTLVTAKRLRRHFLGFEPSPDDAAAIRRRLEAAHPGQALSGRPETTAGGKGARLAGEEPLSPARRSRGSGLVEGGQRGESRGRAQSEAVSATLT
jgi:hypothetical protein